MLNLLIGHLFLRIISGGCVAAVVLPGPTVLHPSK